MAKKDTAESHTFTFGRVPVTVSDELDGTAQIIPWRKQKVCVVYQGTVGPAEMTHRAPIGGTPSLDMLPIMIEPGGSFVEAGLLADHVDHRPSILQRYIDRGELTIYGDPAEALEGSAKLVQDMIALTRDPSMLRAWLAIEQARQTKRGPVIKVIETRLKIYGDHSTPAPKRPLLPTPEMRAAG